MDKSGEISNYYNPSDDRLLYEALKARLKLFHGSGERAFAQPFYKPKRDGSPGPIVNKVKTYHKITTSVEVCGGIANHNDMIRVDIFFIPVFKTKKEYIIICKKCNSMYKLKSSSIEKVLKTHSAEYGDVDKIMYETSTCPRCGANVTGNYQFCPYCGEPLKK